MLGEKFHSGRRVNADLFQAPLFQRGDRPFFQRPAQPVADGDREAALAPIYYIVWQVTPGVALQKNLSLKSPHSVLDAKRCCEFHYCFVQERRTRFQRRTHARAVGLGQQPLRQQRFQIPPLRSVQ